MPDKPEKFEVRVTVRPTTERSPGWDRLWRWLLAPAPGVAQAEASPAPDEGEGNADKLMNHQ